MVAVSERISPHFTRAELACRCGCGLVPPASFVRELEELRVAWGRPLLVTSGARCARYNQVVSTTGPAGPHTVGAVDLALAGAPAFELVRLALAHGWTGVGVKQHGTPSRRFVHLDRLEAAAYPRPRFWSYA